MHDSRCRLQICDSQSHNLTSERNPHSNGDGSMQWWKCEVKGAHLMVRENECIGHNHVLSSSCIEYYYLGDIVRCQRLAAAMKSSVL